MGINLSVEQVPSKQEGFAKNLAGTPWGTALYHPIPYQEKEGVGDIGFWDGQGQWIAVCNAFDPESFARLHLPPFECSDEEAIRTDNAHGHFRLGVGGDFRVGNTNIDVGGSAPVLPAPVTAGATLRFKLGSKKGSLSVLVPGEDDFVIRACRRHMRWPLVHWFRKVEARVWEFVTAYYGHQRPKRIFLVTGQTMTPEYWISHQEKRSTGCEVSIGGEVGIPNIVEGHTYWGYDIGRVRDFRGFEISARKSNTRAGTDQLHSIFFNTESSSAPMNRFGRLKPNSPQVRSIESMYRYLRDVANKEAARRDSRSSASSNNDTHTTGTNAAQGYQNRVALEDGGHTCNWFLLKLGEHDYAIQYSGPFPELHLPPFMNEKGLGRSELPSPDDSRLVHLHFCVTIPNRRTKGARVWWAALSRILQPVTIWLRYFLASMIFVALWLTFSYTVGALSLSGGGFLAQRGVIDYSGDLYVILVLSGTAGFVGAYCWNREDFPPNNVLLALGAGILWIGSNGFNGGDPYTASADVCKTVSFFTWAILVHSGSIPWFSMNIMGKKSWLWRHVDDTLVYNILLVAGSQHIRHQPSPKTTMDYCVAFSLTAPGCAIFEGNWARVYKQLYGALSIISLNIVITSLILLLKHRVGKATFFRVQTAEPNRDHVDPSHYEISNEGSTPYLLSQRDQDSGYASDDDSLGSCTESLIGGLEVNPDESISSYSGDENDPEVASAKIQLSSCSGSENDNQVISARAQLRSIPDPSEPLKLDYQEPTFEEHSGHPLQLSEIIESVWPRSVFHYMPISDVLNVGKVNRHLKSMVDNYFVHYVLPRSEIYFHIDHIMEDGSPPSEEYQRLYPVIRRIDKHKRVFPNDRLVFEPEIEETPKYTYRNGFFDRVQIKFHLGDWRRRENWPLDCPPTARTPYCYKADEPRTRHKLQITRPFQYFRFDTFKDSPIYVFYKYLPGTGGDVVALHAISIPLNYIRQSLCATRNK